MEVQQKKYKDVMKKWTTGTGGGSGDPENYANWETRDPENFARYHNDHGPMLTWIYMVDQLKGGALTGLYFCC